ncbi:hypothetical protein [Brevibacillus brevis]|uniref:DUF7832 domain-containing protein n=1 Tax=Brevibacillus brevis TaxID=1393 RepID=UPI0037C9CFF5
MTTVYDKAKYHYENFEEDLPRKQAYVHTGFFIGWLIENDMVSEDFQKSYENLIAEFKQRKMTGPEVYEKTGGVLAKDMLNEEGNQFAMFYFDFETGEYRYHYLEAFDCEPSVYHVEDTWENYDHIKDWIDNEYEYWCEKNK